MRELAAVSGSKAWSNLCRAPFLGGRGRNRQPNPRPLCDRTAVVKYSRAGLSADCSRDDLSEAVERSQAVVQVQSAASRIEY